MYAGVPQSSDLSSELYKQFIADIFQSDKILFATYTDDIAILATNANPNQVTNSLLTQVNEIDSWAKQWRIKIYTKKSTQITFTLKKISRRMSSIINE
jgi:hypothetical protein